jgi:hypothetical protein
MQPAKLLLILGIQVKALSFALVYVYVYTCVFMNALSGHISRYLVLFGFSAHLIESMGGSHHTYLYIFAV